MIRKGMAVLGFVLFAVILVFAGNGPNTGFRVLSPIVRGNLTIFPVIGDSVTSTVPLLTLDEGLRNGTVVITERGAVQGLVRHGRPVQNDEVNRLVLINNSNRPLILLAGEVVTGGKQDRVIGMDSIVPANSKPLDLSVFCVEHGRWTAKSDHFGSLSSQMVQPSVRIPAMAERNQQGVWDNVAKSNSALRAKVAGAAPALEATTSYATALTLPSVQKEVSGAFDYEAIREELRKSGARGVVVAINGRIEWADIFADPTLLQKYWEKLIRSYAAEAVTATVLSSHNGVSQVEAQKFVDRLSGTREVVESEPGVYRRAEISGDEYKVFSLTSLLNKSELTVHIAKMRYAPGSPEPEAIGLRRR